jgi:hypothetical protein
MIHISVNKESPVSYLHYILHKYEATQAEFNTVSILPPLGHRENTSLAN